MKEALTAFTVKVISKFIKSEFIERTGWQNVHIYDLQTMWISVVRQL